MITDAEERQLRLAVLETIAQEPRLNRRLILRSAAAIRQFYGGPRRTEDLDFVIVRQHDDPAEDAIDDPSYSQRLLDEALVRRLPHHYRDYEDRLPWLKRELKLEVAPCTEPVECRAFEIVPGSGQSILASTLEDAIAGKLVAMIDYHAGGKLRERDLFDVAEVLSRPGRPLDVPHTLPLAVEKAKRRGIELTAGKYDQAMRKRLSHRYETIRDLTGDAFIEFDDAWSTLLALVAGLEAGTAPHRPAGQTVISHPAS